MATAPWEERVETTSKLLETTRQRCLFARRRIASLTADPASYDEEEHEYWVERERRMEAANARLQETWARLLEEFERLEAAAS